MPRYTEVSWSAIRRCGFDARPQIPAGFLASKGFIDMVATSRPLVVGGQFDRAAIMAAAIKAARLHRARYGTTWAAALSIALTAAWRSAKGTRARSLPLH